MCASSGLLIQVPIKSDSARSGSWWWQKSVSSCKKATLVSLNSKTNIFIDMSSRSLLGNKKALLSAEDLKLTNYHCEVNQIQKNTWRVAILVLETYTNIFPQSKFASNFYRNKFKWVIREGRPMGLSISKCASSWQVNEPWIMLCTKQIAK